jgi:hypothetical protein
VYIEKIKEVERIVDRPVEVIKEVTVKEPYEVIKIVEVEKIIEKPIEKIVI